MAERFIGDVAKEVVASLKALPDKSPRPRNVRHADAIGGAVVSVEADVQLGEVVLQVPLGDSHVNLTAAQAKRLPKLLADASKEARSYGG